VAVSGRLKGRQWREIGERLNWCQNVRQQLLFVKVRLHAAAGRQMLWWLRLSCCSWRSHSKCLEGRFYCSLFLFIFFFTSPNMTHFRHSFTVTFSAKLRVGTRCQSKSRGAIPLSTSGTMYWRSFACNSCNSWPLYARWADQRPTGMLWPAVTPVACTPAVYANWLANYSLIWK